MSEKSFAVYMMTNKPRGVLYIGVTARLIPRIREHREGLIKGFTSRYNLDKLVWYAGYPDADSAIGEEKRLKRWRREWKYALVEAKNPEWRDLWWSLAPTTDWD